MNQPHKVKTGSETWQVECWEYAKTNAPFEVEGCADRHNQYFEAIRLAYDYTIEKDGSTVRCTPPVRAGNP